MRYKDLFIMYLIQLTLWLFHLFKKRDKYRLLKEPEPQINTGFDLNFLINSTFKNMFNGESENVTSYHKRFVFSFPILGMGLKTKIHKDIFLSTQTYVSMTNYRLSREGNILVSQVVFPAFQISLSKFLK